MNKDIFQISSCIDKVESCVDGGWRLRIITPELNEEESALLMKLHRKQGWLFFKETSFKPEEVDIPDITPEFVGEKTPSQRERAVLYKIWELTTSREITFEQFYRQEMEIRIDKLKERLD